MRDSLHPILGRTHVRSGTDKTNTRSMRPSPRDGTRPSCLLSWDGTAPSPPSLPYRGTVHPVKRFFRPPQVPRGPNTRSGAGSAFRWLAN